LRTNFGKTRHSIGDDQIDLERLSPSAFLVREQNTLLGRLYSHWISCGETRDNKFLLPLDHAFSPAPIIRENETPLVMKIETSSGALSSDPIDESDLLGCHHPFSAQTRSALVQCLSERDFVYLEVTMNVAQVHTRFMRLLLPVIDEDNQISAIYIPHRFMGVATLPDESAPFIWISS